ncbi:MAG: FeS assembly SUF system protein [Parasphingorhabdus sp.]|jgi:FeS assembly SUF system protein
MNETIEALSVEDINHQSTELSGFDELHDHVIAALKEIFDPEIPVNIYDLGLIYTVNIDPEANVAIDLTLTAPGCPVAQTFPATIEGEVNSVEGVNETHVELVWDPPWTPDRMTEAAKLELGFF